MTFNLQRNSSLIMGYWGAVTASVDWCENNYEISHYVAEFFNSASSFSMVVAGLAGILLHPWAELRFKIAFFTTVLLGVGSVAFHGTLWKFCQALDEVPMLYCVFTFTFIGIDQRFKLSPWNQRILSLALCIHSILTTLLVTLTNGTLQFVLFHASFNSAHVFALYQAYKIYKNRKNSKNGTIKKKDPAIFAFERGSIYYGSAIACWLTDMILCEYVNPSYSSSILPYNPQLHSFWHFFISLGLYYMSILVLVERVDYFNGIGSAKLKYWKKIIPYVAVIREREKEMTSPLITRNSLRSSSKK